MLNIFKRNNRSKNITPEASGASESSGLAIPDGMDFVGGQLFDETGAEFLEYFIDYCDLKKDAKVLDVGCGIGRMAIPLTTYLNAEGSYKGFDIVAEGVDWCSKNLSSRYSNFEFSHVDIFNSQYNPNGKLRADEFSFPYESDSFDFVFLTSVFTHMLPRDLEHYLDEIVRVLKPGGKTLITYFILNEESEKNIETGKSHIDISHEYESIKIMEPTMPEAATGYSLGKIQSLYKEHSMTIDKPIRYGNWCGRTKGFTSYQDIVTATKM